MLHTRLDRLVNSSCLCDTLRLGRLLTIHYDALMLLVPALERAGGEHIYGAQVVNLACLIVAAAIALSNNRDEVLIFRRPKVAALDWSMVLTSSETLSDHRCIALPTVL
jgi:hypothetical protein